ncbi:ribonucleoside reductase class II, partial [Patescibacteria group bacterium]|nr:ribonucleoside reductase class II [Patescibacteria group bacterium]
MKIIEPKQSAVALEITRKRYLMTDSRGRVVETVGEMLWRVAKHITKFEEDKKITEAFYERMVTKKFVCSGKAMFEAGNPGGIGQLAACFVLPIEDSIDSIFKTLGEAAVIHKNNGGTGFNFSKIRPHGDKVKNVLNAASGPVDFIKAFSAALSKILQGAKRQGGNIAILNADHPDIEEFIKMKAEDGTIKNFNVSVGATDEFMKAVRLKKMWRLVNPRNKEVVKQIRANKLFALICEFAWKTADPGMAFLDRMERDNPTPTLGKLEATNPCITGDALIATECGLMEFVKAYENYHNPGRLGLLVDRRAVGREGVEIKPSLQVLYQGVKEVYQLETKSGFRLKATGNHKIMTEDGWKELSQIKAGERVLIQASAGQFSQTKQLPFVWENQLTGKNGRKYHLNLPTRWSKELGVFLGWLVGDGFIRQKYAILAFGSKKLAEQKYFARLLQRWYPSTMIRQPTERTTQIVCHSQFVADYAMQFGVLAVKSAEKRVPKTIFTAPKETVIGFLQGLFGADGTIGFVKDKSSYMRLSSKSRLLLTDVQLLLLNLGIKARIYNRSRPPRRNLFPAYQTADDQIRQYGSDGKLWELEISKDSVIKFLDEVGFLFDRHEEKIKKLLDKSYYSTRFTDEVLAVTPFGKEPVYDVTEPETHSFIANGFVVHNCGEIPLLPYESCNLGSINLSLHVKNEKVDWEDLKKTVKIGVRFLDNMIEVNNYPLEQIKRMVKDGNRRIGLGVMGFSHMLYKLGIAYNSEAGVKLAGELAQFIRTEADKESERLGRERGNFGNYDVSIFAKNGRPRRNCATTMIAPTGTISMFADCSSGIEPVFSLSTTRRTFFEDSGKNSSTKEIIVNDPIYQEYKNKYDQEVFVTAQEIGWRWHVKIQAAWQKYFDNS